MSSPSLIASSLSSSSYSLSSSSRKMKPSVRFIDDDHTATPTVDTPVDDDTGPPIQNQRSQSQRKRQSRSAWKSSSLIYRQSTQPPIVVHRRSSIIDLMVDEEQEKKKKEEEEQDILFIRPILKTKSHSLSPTRENLQLRQHLLPLPLSAHQQDRLKNSQQRSAWKSTSKSIAPPPLVQRKVTMTQAELMEAAKEIAQFDLECDEKRRSKKEFIDVDAATEMASFFNNNNNEDNNSTNNSLSLSSMLFVDKEVSFKETNTAIVRAAFESKEARDSFRSLYTPPIPIRRKSIVDDSYEDIIDEQQQQQDNEEQQREREQQHCEHRLCTAATFSSISSSLTNSEISSCQSFSSLSFPETRSILKKSNGNNSFDRLIYSSAPDRFKATPTPTPTTANATVSTFTTTTTTTAVGHAGGSGKSTTGTTITPSQPPLPTTTTTTAVATKVTVARPTNLPPLRPFRQLSILSLDSNYFSNGATTLKLIEDIENENENDCENEDGNDDSELDDDVEEDEMLFSSTTCTCTSTANNTNTNSIISSTPTVSSILTTTTAATAA